MLILLAVVLTLILFKDGDCYRVVTEEDKTLQGNSQGSVVAPSDGNNGICPTVADGLAEFETYMRNNQEFIPNFGDRKRQGGLAPNFETNG